MSENNKKYYVNARVTKEEKEKINKMAKDNGMTTTNLILNSLENHITVNLDTSDYRDFVIQFRRIGTNINSLIKNIYYKEFFTDDEIKSINRNLEILKQYVEDEGRKIKETKNEIENLTPRKVKRILEKENKPVPIFLIYDKVVDHINSQLLDFIEMLRENDFDEIYIPYITLFLEEFHPTDYDYEELVKFSNELDELFYKINQTILSGYGELTEEDFEGVMDILNKYRKVSD